MFSPSLLSASTASRVVLDSILYFCVVESHNCGLAVVVYENNLVFFVSANIRWDAAISTANTSA